MSEKYSVSPNGEKFPLPKPEDYKAEFENIKKRVKAERAKGREIVVVMGVGFVGAVMAAIVADTVDKKGKPSKFVIGMQRPKRTQLLEDTDAQPRHLSCQGRGPRSGPDDSTMREGQENADGHLHL